MAPFSVIDRPVLADLCRTRPIPAMFRSSGSSSPEFARFVKPFK